MIEETKKCPYCAETIKAEAIVCRYCGRDLRTGIVGGNPNQGITASVVRPSQVKNKQSLSGGDIIISLLLPIVGLILAVVYIFKEETRSRGFALMAVSIIFWIVWWFVCSAMGGLSSF